MKKGPGLRVGVIGVGTMGRHHARILSASIPGVKLSGVADFNEPVARETGELYGIPSFTNYKDLFPLVDALILATPTASHFEIGKDCLENRKPLLVEKPLAKTSPEAELLIKIAKEHGLVLAVGHIERFNPAFQELAKIIRKEKIIGIDIKRLSPFPERIADANVIQDMMIHDLDLLRTLLPLDQIDEIKASGEIKISAALDRVLVNIYYKSGIIASLEASRIFGSKSRKLAVTTESGLYEADLLEKRIYFRNFQHALPSVHKFKIFDQLTAELKDFFLAIKKSRPPLVDGEAGYQAIKLGEEIEKLCS